jgi:hypothetical protein
MNLDRLIRAALPRPVRNHLQATERRLSSLEMIVDMMLDDDFEPTPEAGFNQQVQRKQIFEQIISSIALDRILETGCFIGNSTSFMSQASGLPVLSSEINPHFFRVARRRLAGLSGVVVEQTDSRQFLRSIVERGLCGERTFFYLDAHWREDLPLREEVELIGTHWSQFVIMIDDFEVPDDPGYGFDRYGRDKMLTLAYLRQKIDAHNLVAFFPAARSESESGGVRGCVVLANDETYIRQLEQVPSLRRY